MTVWLSANELTAPLIKKGFGLKDLQNFLKISNSCFSNTLKAFLVFGEHLNLV